MNVAIEYLSTDLGLDTRSAVRAVTDAGMLEFDENKYREIIGELLGTDDVNVGDKYAAFTFRYLVYDAVSGKQLDLLDAESRAIKYVDAHPWVNAKPVYEYEPKQTVDALGQPKQKKGAKKQAAIKLWKEWNEVYTDLTRKEWIRFLAEQVGLTEAAASTYHYNLRTGKWK